MGTLIRHRGRWGMWGAMVAATLVGTQAEADQLRVMTLNVHHGMQQANELANTATLVRASGAHVVGIQEDQGAAQQLASVLGWHYTTQVDADGDGVDIAILSQFPIANKSENGVEIALGYGRTAHVFNTHLHANPYQPYLIRDGSITNETEAIASAEGARGAMLDLVLNQMSSEIASGAPVFLLGDMNEPSHLDWTAAAASTGLHPFAVAYPASTSIEAAGLTDSYREAHPDPVARPGYTWTNRPGANEVHDRIDFVHYAGEGVSVLTSRVVGERNAPEGVSIFPSREGTCLGTIAVWSQRFRYPTASLPLIPIRSLISRTATSLPRRAPPGR